MVVRFLTYPLVFLSIALSVSLVPSVADIVMRTWKVYLPLLSGMGAYIIMGFIPFLSKNREHLRTLSHEFTHWLVGICFFHKIHALNVQGETGYVSHSGGRFGDMFIGLSPYCIPVFTVLLLFLRMIIIPGAMVGFDVAVGLTLAFHIGCFATQMGIHQTDITERGIFKSYVFIIAVWLFFALLILLTIKYNLFEAVEYIFKGYWHNLETFYKFMLGLFAK